MRQEQRRLPGGADERLSRIYSSREPTTQQGVEGTRERFGLRQSASVATIVAAAAVTSLVLAIGALASGNAGYTTFIDASTCVPGSVVNCNTYVAKTDVWTNGGPSTGSGLLDDGDYFFAVLVPGIQNGGFIDGAAGNLSDATQSAGRALESVRYRDQPGIAHPAGAFRQHDERRRRLHPRDLHGGSDE